MFLFCFVSKQVRCLWFSVVFSMILGGFSRGFFWRFYMMLVVFCMVHMVVMVLGGFD